MANDSTITKHNLTFLKQDAISKVLMKCRFSMSPEDTTLDQTFFACVDNKTGEIKEISHRANIDEKNTVPITLLATSVLRTGTITNLSVAYAPEEASDIANASMEASIAAFLSNVPKDE